MMADGVEAASKSLKNLPIETLTAFVQKSLTSKWMDKQFINSNITLAEIETLKKYFSIS